MMFFSSVSVLLSLVAAVVQFALLAEASFPYRGPVQRSEASPLTCNVHWRYRRPCGVLFTSAHACQRLGCCFQFVLYGPMCFHQEFDLTAQQRIIPKPQTTSSTTASTTPKPTTVTTTTVSTTTSAVPSTSVNANSPARTYRTMIEIPKTDREILEFLALLSMRGNVNRVKAPRSHTQKTPVTESNSRHHSFSGVMQASASTEALNEEEEEEAPASRGVGRQATGRETCDYSVEAERVECGHPGITPPVCRKKGCCWHHGVENKAWCFRKTEILIAPPLPEEEDTPETRDDLLVTVLEEENANDPAIRNTYGIFPEEELVEPPLPSFGKNNSLPTNESGFRALVQQEMSGMDSSNEWSDNTTASTTITTLTTTGTTRSSIGQGGDPLWLQQLVLEAATAPTPQKMSTGTTTSTTPTTTTPTTTSTSSTTDVLPPFTDNLSASSSQEEMERSRLLLMGIPPDPTPQTPAPPEPSHGQSAFRDLAVLLKLIGDLQQKQRQHTTSRCVLNDQDSCCRSNPYAPCCEFQMRRRLGHRAAPLTRIVGGGPAGQLRHSVAYLARGMYKEQFCGGTLIDNQWVLTAAHCVLEYCQIRSSQELVVTLGKYHKSPLYRDIGQQVIGVSHVICHHSHCKSPDQPRLNDLALIKLKKPAATTMYVSPATMPAPYESPDPSQKCIMLGWGSTEGTGYATVLKEVSVPLVSNNQCNLPDWRNCVIRACMMCAGALNNDPCEGDSGGPLFCQRSNGLYVLHGVYSWGRCGFERKKPAVYMRTSYFVEWITNIMATLQ